MYSQDYALLMIFVLFLFSYGVKCVQELSANALEHVRINVSEYDAHSKEKNALKNVVRKKIIQNKDWSMLHKIFNESPLVIFSNCYSNLCLFCCI